ncbi:MAG: GNAT family N-acetyltransferase [Clostridia bacterium]
MIELIKNSEFDVINEIIEKSFPEHEIRDYDKQKELLNNPLFNIYVMRDVLTGKIKAFISIWNIEDYIFVDHFAVSSEFRNEGLGSKILQEIKDILKKKIFLEVEPPKSEIDERRIKFYQKNGFLLNDYKYKLPSLVEGLKPMTMMIMSTGEKLTYEKFQSLTQELMRVVYN